jgi:AAHS family 4-hydroxybenzoate transporter-like MFS transporter
MTPDSTGPAGNGGRSSTDPHGSLERAGMPKTVDVGAILGEARLSSLPILVLVLSFIVIMLDGYDLICLSFVAPQLARIFDIPVASFGPVFTAGYIGIMIGGVLIGPLADRFGRKNILIFSVALFGLFSLMPIADLSYSHLIAYRFITGLGLGGAMPGAVALTAEYAPSRLRGLFVNLMFVGVATGGVVGGFIASQLVPTYGWTTVFWMGGVAPLALVPILVWLMPESISFLAVKKRRPEYIAQVLNRFIGAQACSASDTFVVQEAGKEEGSGLRKLFSEGRARGTLLIWLTSFSVLLTYGLLSSWLPTFMTMEGMTTQTAILGPVVLNLGGIVGTILLGLLFTRLGASPIIAGALACTALSLFIVSQTIGIGKEAMLAIFATGMFLLGSVNSTNTLMSAFYPTSIRATGVGWALGVGRIGGALGPAGGGLMLSLKVSPSAIFQTVALVALVGLCAVTLVGVLYPAHRRPVRPVAAAPLPA